MAQGTIHNINIIYTELGINLYYIYYKNINAIIILL